MTRRILFIDDSAEVLDALRRMLQAKRDDWSMSFVSDPYKAWDLLQADPFDAVISDVKMPGRDGLELLQLIKASEATKDIPVVMLTGLGDRDLKRRALELGAADLLNKPVEPEDLVARIQNVLQLKACQDELRNQNTVLEEKVRERTAELVRSRLDVVWRLGKAAEHRDNETGHHVVRVGCMCRTIGAELGMDREFVETLFVAAPLHDIGKVGIPDAILLKRGPFSDAERHVMMRHCWIGERILKEDAMSERVFERMMANTHASDSERRGNPLIEMAAKIALSHHENWDGSGYPERLAGESIPLEARITAIADVFDALLSHRPYKAPYAEEEALRIIRDAAGSKFDPRVHAAFERALPDLRHIRDQLRDEPSFSEGEEVYDVPRAICR